MKTIETIGEQTNSGEVSCLHCGEEASWRLIGQVENVVEIVCPDCGRFELLRTEFEKTEADRLEPDQPLG